MLEKTIGILDNQSIFAERLKNYINNKQDIGCFAVAFQDEEELARYCKSKKPATLLLGEEVAERVRKQGIDTGEARVWIFTDQPREGNRDYIFRYQKAGELIRTILQTAEAELERLSELYTVFSPESGRLAENYACKLAERLSEKGKVLLLPWDPFLGFGREEEQGTSISELLYLVRKDRERAEALFQRLPVKGGAEYFMGPDFCTDLWQYSVEEMRQLMRYCREAGAYKYVIFLAGCFHEGVIAIMNQSNGICLVSTESKDGIRRKKEFYRQMKYAGEQEILSRLTEVTIPGKSGKAEEK